MPQVLWTRYFLQAQGFTVSDSVIYQDNQSSILLEKNGRASSSKPTRHINIRYFFVTDRVANHEVKIEYCPTLEMLAHYFTKPLQGSQFITLRNCIMTINLNDQVHQDYRSVLAVAKLSHSTDAGWTVVKNKRQVTTSKIVITQFNDQHPYSKQNVTDGNKHDIGNSNNEQTESCQEQQYALLSKADHSPNGNGDDKKIATSDPIADQNNR